MWICLCEAITSGTIREVIDSGAETLEEIQEACGAGTVCGKCKRNIHLLVREHRAEARQSSDARTTSKGGRWHRRKRS